MPLGEVTIGMHCTPKADELLKLMAKTVKLQEQLVEAQDDVRAMLHDMAKNPTALFEFRTEPKQSASSDPTN